MQIPTVGAMSEKLSAKFNSIFTSKKSSISSPNGNASSPAKTSSRGARMSPPSPASQPPPQRPLKPGSATIPRPQPSHPPPLSKPSRSSTPLPSKLRHNSYPQYPHQTQSMANLRSKIPLTPLLMSRSERNAQESRIASAESEVCRGDLLKQGIKIRDFQREVDERGAYERSEAALRRKMEEAEKEEKGGEGARSESSVPQVRGSGWEKECGGGLEASSDRERLNGGGADGVLCKGREERSEGKGPKGRFQDVR